jgi:hypothetical protein
MTSARNRADGRGLTQPGEEHKLRNVGFVCPLCFFVGDVAEPFGLRWYVGEFLILGGS